MLSCLVLQVLIIILERRFGNSQNVTVVMMMMIRDEEENVRANLGKWERIVDYLVCGVDERTKDGSGRTVAEIIGHKPHWIFYFRFENFGQGRTVVLREAWRKFSHASHALIIDPDWLPIEKTLIKDQLDFEHRKFSFLVYDRNGLTTRNVAWLIRHEEGLEFRYRLHEVLVLPKNSIYNTTNLRMLSWQVKEVEVKGRRTWHTTEHGNATNVGHSMSYKRYLRDLDLLYLDLEELGPNDPHTLYYLGATHLACIDAILGVGFHKLTEQVLYHINQGIFYLEQRVQPNIIDLANRIGGNSEETWAAVRWLAHSYHNYKRDYNKAHYWYKKCHEMDPLRVDCATFHASLYRTSGDYTSAWNSILIPLQFDFTDGQRTFAHNFYIYNCTLPLEASLILLPLLEAQKPHEKHFLDQTGIPGIPISNWLILLAFGRRLLLHAETTCIDPSRKFISAQPEDVEQAHHRYDSLQEYVTSAQGPDITSRCLQHQSAFAAANYDPNHLAMLVRWGLHICDDADTDNSSSRKRRDEL
uniref:Glycosyltransferase 2-like domain-containing protein n=1 Tax=Aureoumbra lagunensis TaxID=44058 RepID=A0A7S3NFA2_9STRA